MEPWQQELVKTQNMLSSQIDDAEYTRYKQDETYYWWHIAQMIFYDAYVNSNEVNNILDIGCGYGTLLFYAKLQYGAKAFGIDMHDKMPVDLKKIFDVQFFKSKIEKFNIDTTFKNVVFDRIIFTEIIEHLQYNPVTTLKRIHNILSDDGFLYLSTPDASAWGRVDKFIDHVGEYKEYDGYLPDIDEHIYQFSEGELRRIIAEAGFCVNEIHFTQPPFWGAHFNLKLEKE
jgi:cyclopropane fatty-acyl-phospholipid synthase-like methyltransferase